MLIFQINPYFKELVRDLQTQNMYNKSIFWGGGISTELIFLVQVELILITYSFDKIEHVNVLHNAFDISIHQQFIPD